MGATTKRLQQDHPNGRIKPDTQVPEIAFLRAELDTGFTFSKIALGANYEDKRARNQANARRAYDTILHFLPSTDLEADEATEIKSKLEQLKSGLKVLGEKI